MRAVKQQSTPTGEICDKCGGQMLIRLGRYGQYIACANYPATCRNTRDLDKPAEEKEVKADAGAATENSANGASAAPEHEPCDLCGLPMALKRGRFGQFLGCTGYPECKNIRKLGKTGTPAAAPVTLDEKCPDCGSNMVKKQGRFGEFTACSNLS